MEGKCKWYHKDKGFGVIYNDDGVEFFVHRSELKNSSFLKENQMVTFTQSTQKTKNTATEVYVKNPKNTVDFKPNYDPPDLRVDVKMMEHHITKHELNTRTVYVIPDMFRNFTQILDKISRETESAKVEFKYWHGDSHWIADDKAGNWKEHTPVFNEILNIISEYFKMDIKASRLNWYEDQSEWKPFHHDAAAVKKDKALTQNVTVGVSFGATRDICFQHAKHLTRVSVPLPDGYVYAFGKDVNVEWMHGIPAEKNTRKDTRISIIAWGYSTLFE